MNKIVKFFHKIKRKTKHDLYFHKVKIVNQSQDKIKAYKDYFYLCKNYNIRLWLFSVKTNKSISVYCCYYVMSSLGYNFGKIISCNEMLIKNILE